MTSSLRDPMASHYSWMFTSRRIEVPYAAVILVHGGGWSAGSKRANFIQPLFGPLDESGFRHSFAVSRLAAWYREGAVLPAKMPLLTTYVGHATVTCTEVYLQATAELLQEANKRFYRHCAIPAFKEVSNVH